MCVGDNMKKIKEFLTNHNVLQNEKIVVACSGGPDSMFLLCSLQELGYTCICAHVNHNVRKVSEDEYKFVENFCNIHNIIFEGMKIDHYKKDNFHNEARNIRYDFFKCVVKKYNAKYLATAHHGDDLIETILMRLNRGSNLAGYKGFSSFEILKDYTIIRPLKEYTKEEIKEKIEAKEIPHVIDSSNDSDKYTRNRYRHHVLNFLKKENKNVHIKYNEFSDDLSEVVAYINDIAKIKLKKYYHNGELNLLDYLNEPKVIKKTILELILSNIYQNDINLINKTHIKTILDIIDNEKPQITIDLPNKLKIIKSYNKLLFKKDNQEKKEYEYIFSESLNLPNGNKLIKLDEDNTDTSNYIFRLNSNSVKLPLIVRTRKCGDKMLVKNMNHAKKIKEIFIENKINNNERKSWPIVCDNNGQIIWLPGLKKSNLDVKKSDNYDIIIKYILKGEK